MERLNLGSTLQGGKYRIVDFLGQGSFGITYLAKTRVSVNGQLGKLEVSVNVTIKEFFMSDFNVRSSDGVNVERTDSSLVKNYRQKFRREAENLSKLDHPNIVKVLEVFDENNTTYYVMEYVDGCSVDDYIVSRGHLPESEALQITRDVCSALSYMHGHRMLHLDLKPKNMMRSKEGKIFLIDFGLAKQYLENGEPESSTSLGLGTPGYAPIEQSNYRQDGSFPETLDIYALGASLYKMLTGQAPPDSSFVLNEGLPCALLHQLGVSKNTIAVLEKSMAPIKKDRYQTVKSFSSAMSHRFVDKEETIIQHVDERSNGYEHTKEDSTVESPSVSLDVGKPSSQGDSHRLPFGFIFWLISIGLILFVAFNLLSGNTKKPVEVVEEAPVEEAVADILLNAEDTTAVLSELGVATVEEADATIFQEKLDAILAEKYEAYEAAQKAE